jgi:hypothetical protein
MDFLRFSVNPEILYSGTTRITYPPEKQGQILKTLELKQWSTRKETNYLIYTKRQIQ